jgi:hypothetical protein
MVIRRIAKGGRTTWRGHNHTSLDFPSDSLCMQHLHGPIDGVNFPNLILSTEQAHTLVHTYTNRRAANQVHIMRATTSPLRGGGGRGWRRIKAGTRRGRIAGVCLFVQFVIHGEPFRVG